MKKKDFIDVILKIGGLFILLQMVSTNLTGSILMLLRSMNSYSLIFLAINILIISLLLYFFILRTEVILGLMKIDEGAFFFEKTDLNKSSILSVGIILIGVFILVNSIAKIIIEATDLILNSVTSGNGYFDWHLFIYLILGSILIAKNNQIMKMITK